MADKNIITVTGYLKENTLEQFVSQSGVNAIRGNLVISTSPVESHRVQFYVSETTSSGAESKEYKNLLNMLPEHTTTIASYLEANPEANYETACEFANKVWAAGYLDEYTKKTDKGENTIIQLRGRRAGYKNVTVTPEQPFETKAKFEVEVYIEALDPEVDATGAETGRYILTGLLPNYDQSVNRITFVAPVENGVAEYISKNYKVSDTTHINGTLVNIMNRVLISSAADNHFGSGGRDQYETTFINERVIEGGDAKPIAQGAEGSITTAAVKIGLSKREGKIAANSNKAPASTKASFGKFTPIEDVDF